MNKKFSTLMASLLLAGGMFSTANASQWISDNQYVLNTGKYHLIQQVADYNGTWSAIGGTPYYLSLNNSGDPIITQTESSNAYWTITTKMVAGVTYYQLTNAEGKVLTYTHNAGLPNEKKIDWFIVESTTTPTLFNDLSFMDGSDKYFLGLGNPINVTDYAVKFDTTSGSTILKGFNNVEIDEEPIAAKDLNAKWKDGFYVQIGKSGKNAYNEYQNWAGEGNLFSGKLTAEGTTNGNSTTYYLKSGDQYIVLTDELWGGTSSDLNGTDAYKGYKFDLVSEHTFQTDYVQAGKADNATFTIEKTYDFDQAYGDSLIVTMPNAKVGSMAAQTDVRLFVADVNNQSYLTIIESSKANDRLSSDADIKKNSNELPYVRFGATASNIVNIPQAFAGKIWNITTGTGANVQSLSPVKDFADIDEYEELFAPINQVDLTNPEGQWLLYKDVNNNNEVQYYFVNRESGAQFRIAEEVQNDAWVIRSTSTAGKYEIYKDQYEQTAENVVYITEAKEAELGLTEKGYVKFDMDKEYVNGKYLSFETSLGVTAYIGKDADDNVILTTDESKAIEFRVKQLNHNFSDHDGIAAPDTLEHYTSYLKYNANKNLVTDVDTLRFFHYALYENFSEKYLKYDRVNKKFILDDDTDFSPLNAHEKFAEEYRDYTFVVKEKEDGSYILVREYAIDYDNCSGTPNHNVRKDWNGNDYTFDNTFEVNFYKNAYDMDDDHTNGLDSRADGAEVEAHKAYAATQPGTLADMAGIYNYNDNDRITMEDTDKAEYLKVTGSQDTVKISLQNFQNFYLYEQGVNGTNFLGMNHVADVNDMKAAILADTAYVRYNTYRPQYLLAVGTTIKPEIPCEIPGHPTLHPDTVYGRFLVNMVDSAKAWTGTNKTNPYIWEELNNKPYYRLAFIDGYHTGDALTLNTAGGKKKIALNNTDDKVCTFAFRYVDESREGVKIETTYDGKTRGWLKYQNNVPVVTYDYNDAHVFTVDNTTTDAPTANETISAGNVVVAGTNGAVVVKGAEGKNVIVSTILGKVVANEVVSSDNAQITAPAGIVVVSVDGESLKVVVK